MATATKRDWSQPSNVSDVDVAFPAVVRDMMPSMNDIPAEFKNANSQNKWLKMQRRWFFDGLDKRRLKRKKGVDFDTALRHLACIQGSWEPKHEHKEAAVAYLASLWFDDFLPE